MCCKSWKTFLPLVITFLVSSLLTGFIQNNSESKNVSEKSVKSVFLTKTENVNEIPSERPPCVSLGGRGATPPMITYKPRAKYTESAKINRIQGTVKLKVTFLVNREIGQIKVVNYLPYGLTEQAVAAAKQIKFSSATNEKGKDITATKLLQYNFTLY